MKRASLTNSLLALTLHSGCGGDDGQGAEAELTECVGGQFCPAGMTCVDGFCQAPNAEDSGTSGDGDGDGPTTGDGDGDGDGDNPTTGDGDGDQTTGDGDGDQTTGDGDGSPDGVCGDDVVDLDEECDDGDTLGGDGCSAECTLEARLVFLTSELYDGNLGGLAGADQKCQTLADAAGLPGTYLAWLSTTDDSPASRFSHSTLPYVTVTGVQIADDWTDLTDGTLDAPISVTELGTGGPMSFACEFVPAAWTATHPDGTLDDNQNCADWTSSEGPSNWGLPSSIESAWTQWCSGGSCSWSSSLYCFMQ